MRLHAAEVLLSIVSWKAGKVQDRMQLLVLFKSDMIMPLFRSGHWLNFLLFTFTHLMSFNAPMFWEWHTSKGQGRWRTSPVSKQKSRWKTQEKNELALWKGIIAQLNLPYRQIDDWITPDKIKLVVIRVFQSCWNFFVRRNFWAASRARLHFPQEDGPNSRGARQPTLLSMELKRHQNADSNARELRYLPASHAGVFKVLLKQYTH